jgi:hypothetical protein
MTRELDRMTRELDMALKGKGAEVCPGLSVGRAWGFTLACGSEVASSMRLVYGMGHPDLWVWRYEWALAYRV